MLILGCCPDAGYYWFATRTGTLLGTVIAQVFHPAALIDAKRRPPATAIGDPLPVVALVPSWP